jgi:hypothetical protein
VGYSLPRPPALQNPFPCCPVEIISLTPRFNAVNHDHAREKPLKRFSPRAPFAPG